jgi:hypothetical protein
MAGAEQVAAIIESLGPRDHAIEGIIQRGDGEYVVDYDDLEVTLEFETETDRLVLLADLGQAPRDKRLAVYTTLLNYSLLWRDTGGVHMALTVDGEVMQMVTLAGAELTADLLDTVLRNFAAKARLMRAYVGSGGSEDTPIDSLMPLGLRV